jgi:acetyl-CoA carboxylase alpha subunit
MDAEERAKPKLLQEILGNDGELKTPIIVCIIGEGPPVSIWNRCEVIGL